MSTTERQDKGWQRVANSPNAPCRPHGCDIGEYRDAVTRRLLLDPSATCLFVNNVVVLLSLSGPKSLTREIGATGLALLL